MNMRSSHEKGGMTREHSKRREPSIILESYYLSVEKPKAWCNAVNSWLGISSGHSGAMNEDLSYFCC